MRKSPIRHHVRSHRRCGRPVHDYDRGKGSRPAKIAKPRLRKPQPSAQTDFVVIITYERLPSETLKVTASNYPEAIETALTIRKEITPPYKLDVKRIK